MDDDPNRDETTTTGKGITDTESRPVRVEMDVLESGFVYPIKCKHVKLDIILGMNIDHLCFGGSNVMGHYRLGLQYKTRRSSVVALQHITVRTFNAPEKIFEASFRVASCGFQAWPQ
jgi:hypothetical protein